MRRQLGQDVDEDVGDRDAAGERKPDAARRSAEEIEPPSPEMDDREQQRDSEGE
jgi:hypothetical protein